MRPETVTITECTWFCFEAALRGFLSIGGTCDAIRPCGTVLRLSTPALFMRAAFPYSDPPAAAADVTRDANTRISPRFLKHQRAKPDAVTPWHPAELHENPWHG